MGHASRRSSRLGRLSLGLAVTCMVIVLGSSAARGQSFPVAVTVQFNNFSYMVNENGGAATITVTLSASSDQTVTVAYATSDGTATAPADYTSTSGTLSFAPGEVSKTFQVPIIDDTLVEGPETFNLTLSNPSSNASLGTPSMAMLTIIDDDVPLPTVQFTFASYSVNENAGTATITASLSVMSGQPITVDYATSDGTATSPADYTSTSGTLIFPPGTLSASFQVPIANDWLVEGDETVQLTLSNPGNATLGMMANATLTILDVPPLFTVTSASAAVCAGGKSTPIHQTTLTARLTDATGLPWAGVGISFSTDHGTLSAASRTTDGSGQAMTILTSDNTASETPSSYIATVTGQVSSAGPSATTQVEFQPPQVQLTAFPGTIYGSDTATLTVVVTWNGQPVSGHAIIWRVSRAWDYDGIQVYGGSGSSPSDYGTITASSSSQTDSSGTSTATFGQWTSAGTAEIEAADGDVVAQNTGTHPSDKKPVRTEPMVARIQYFHSVDEWVDAPPSPLYVLKGTSIKFKAIPDPANATWPAGKPVWGGTSTATGTGAQVEVSFNTLGEKTVTATCNNTKTVTVIVTDIVVTFDKSEVRPGIGNNRKETVTATVTRSGGGDAVTIDLSSDNARGTVLPASFTLPKDVNTQDQTVTVTGVELSGADQDTKLLA